MSEKVRSRETWRRALVYGLGTSGRAAIRLLRRNGVLVTGVDGRSAEDVNLDLSSPELSGEIEWRLGQEPARLPRDVDAVVLSPGVPADRPLLEDARSRGIPILAEVELAFRYLVGPVVAITGSNGKSTTTAMTGELLSAAGRTVEVCGNIGTPLSSVVEGPTGRTFVVELSSFQLETVDRFHPQAAALLNLSPDHLDRYPSFADYVAAKRRIFARQGHGDVAVLNADDREVAATPLPAGVRCRWFSRSKAVDDGCFLTGDRVLEARPGAEPMELFRVGDVSVEGPHNLENAMAAALLARARGVDAAVLAPALRSFVGLPHRLQRVAERGGVVYYDDSKGTNIAATAQSLAGFEDGQVHLILGGRNKGGDPAELRCLALAKVRQVYLIGEAAPEFAQALSGVATCVSSGTLATAVRDAAAAAHAGEVVLLSPACASFDQFENYVARGLHFQELVRDLPAEERHG